MGGGLEGKIGQSSSSPMSSSLSLSSASSAISPVLPTSSSSSSSASSLRASSSSFETLDEPVSETILRDVRMVAQKIRHVLIPTDSTTVKELRDWDLWGPLLLCLLLALSLSFSSSTETSQTAAVFAGVFVIVWVGAGVVTINAQLLGGHISFLQSVCVLGYCIAPLVLASLVTHLLSAWWVHWLVVAVAFVWSTKASVGFMSVMVPGEKRALGVYPVLLFYFSIAWLILVSSVYAGDDSASSTLPIIPPVINGTSGSG